MSLALQGMLVFFAAIILATVAVAVFGLWIKFLKRTRIFDWIFDD